MTSTSKPITVTEIVSLMRRANAEGYVIDPTTRQIVGHIRRVLFDAGATAEQAAKAARRLGWVSDSPEDWTDAEPALPRERR